MAKQDNKIAIAKALSDGKFHSGEQLGKELGISRAAIAKHVKSLTLLGIDIFSVTGKGYRLAEPFNLIDQQRLMELCGNNLNIEVHGIIDSTNQRLMDLIRSKQDIDDGLTVISECQTEGRGRRGRSWVSPFGSHIYLSRYFKSHEGLSEVAALSLVIGLAISNAIERYTGVVAELKWPNDVMVNNKKLAGVLVEAEGQSDGFCHLVIGIGINVNMPEESAELITQPWTDLQMVSKKTIDRNEFIAVLLAELDKVIDAFRVDKLTKLYKLWNNRNAFEGDVVNITTGDRVKSGRCIGIDETGALLIEEDNVISRIFGGEVSLRRA